MVGQLNKLFVSASMAIVLMLGGTASAQDAASSTMPAPGATDLLESGLRLYALAEFEGALAALGELLASTDLTRAQLEQAFQVRALIYHALGATSDVRRALSAMVTLGAQPPDDFPPALLVAFGEVRARQDPLALRLRAREVEGDAIEVEVDVDGDPSRLVEGFQLTWSVEGADAEMVTAPIARISLRGEELRVTGRVTGPGGIALWTEAAPGRRVPVVRRAGEIGEGLAWGLGLGAGALVIVGVAIAVGIVLTTPGDTQLAAPIIMSF